MLLNAGRERWKGGRMMVGEWGVNLVKGITYVG